MAYIKKDNYPLLRKPGVYPDGTNTELGLDRDNLEKFSLGSWEEFSLSNRRFVFSNIFTNDIQNANRDGLEGFEKENLFGFAYVDDEDSDNQMIIGDVVDKIKLINYDKNQSINMDAYKKSSFPVKINFGIDFDSSTEASNYGQIKSEQLDTLTILPEDIDIVNTTEFNQLIANPSNFFANDDSTLWETDWNIAYLNYKDPGNPTPEEITPIILNHETTPFVIKWNTFGVPTSEGNIGSRRYALPNGAYRIEFTTPISKTDFPIKILDRVKLFDYWDHEYTVIDIIGTGLDDIFAIQLDVVYPGDINADAFAQANATLGYLAGEDWLDFNAATNKVMYLPAPFELRANSGQDETSFDTNDVSTTNLAEAYTWAHQNNEVDHRAASLHEGGTPVLRSEDMPSHYNIVISRPKSTEAESKFGFTKLEFEADDIKTKDGNVELSLFKEPIPRSPRQLSQDISPQLLSKQYLDSVYRNELIGFRDSGNWSGTGTNAIAVSGEVLATNVTMRARHGYYERDLPPERDGNNKGDGKEWSGLSWDTQPKFPLLSSGVIFADSSALGYPTITWTKDLEFIFYPNIDLTFEADLVYRVKFNISVFRETTDDNDDYNLEIGVGVLDTSEDPDDDGIFYNIKALQNTHLETDLGNFPDESNAWFETSVYGKIFTNELPAQNLKGIPYITINSIQRNSGGTFNQSGANYADGSISSNAFTFRITSYELEEVVITDTDQAAIQAISTTPLYKYKVLNWGDEKQKLTNDQILNSFYLSWYNTETPSDWVIKQYAHEALSVDNFIKTYDMNDGNGYFNLTSHVYNSPGLKSIKAIVYRLNQAQSEVQESKLITTNILINDGSLTSQDFSIFGGTDFNFLPLANNEVIIGGLDEDSKYNNSVEKIKQNDNFIQDDYLERASSREFINNFNKKLYGETPGQLDLSTTRMYKKPLDIYDFITDDKQSIVDNNFNINTLPINSSATDIFISNNDCIVDLNPQDIEYLSIQNKTGTADKAILIGDYKVNQPKDGKVQREGVMQTPLLEQNTDKQAF